MNILLTGGSGFIGRNIFEALSEDHVITAPRRSELDLTDDRAVRNFFRSHTFDVVIHGAVKPGHRNAPDLSRQLYVNTRMFFNIVRNDDRYDRMIFLGSGAVYGANDCPPKVREDSFDARVPEDEHAFSKYIIAKYIETQKRITELRLFGVFGKYEDYAIRFISNAICKTLHDLPITIKQNRRFDYLFIDDLMPVIKYFLRAPVQGRAYNVTPDAAVDLLSIAETVKKVSGKQVPLVVRDAGFGLDYSGDNSRLKREIPELSFTPLEQAISRLYAWYSKHRDAIDREKLLIDK